MGVSLRIDGGIGQGQWGHWSGSNGQSPAKKWSNPTKIMEQPHKNNGANPNVHSKNGASPQKKWGKSIGKMGQVH